LFVSAWRHTFTVFTPTFNRAHTLHRVYESLRAQTLRDFEWLIVDDGSTDGTRALVEGWQAVADFPIRYIWKENGGKHTAHNVAIAEATGKFFVILDSDDECVPNALERLASIWDSIPAEEQGNYGFVRVLCSDVDGQVIGDRFPRDVLVARMPDVIYRFRIRGDKWGFSPAHILRDYPFPEIRGVSHIPEDIIWMRIAERYVARCVNESLLIVHSEPGSLSRPTGSSSSIAARIAPAFSVYYQQMLNDLAWYARYDPKSFLRMSIHYVRFSLHQGHSFLRQWQELHTGPGRALFLAGLVPGCLVYARDRVMADKTRRGL
jgi:glycosyltransferase involved in cell wall biosynthesis